MITKFLKVFAPLFDLYAWLMLLVGSVLFSARIPLPTESYVNLPVLETLLQITGGLFVICGFSLIVSRLFWRIKYDVLQVQVLQGNVAAGILLAGLKIFNGLVVLGCAVWLALAFTGGR